SMKRWLWLGGWAFSVADEERIAKHRWPEIEHRVIAPGELCFAKLRDELDGGGYDRLLGYSLGSLLILRERETLPTIPTTLFAPILDFKAESGQGGRIEARRLPILLRWLKRDPMAALVDFYQQAGLRPRLQAAELPYNLADLQWGIEQLRDLNSTPPDSEVTAFIGTEDRLIDAQRLQACWPGVQVVPGVGHDLEALLEAVDVAV
ncbi:MAG: alpha/beta fold hydrolase, partial [Puniceicoccales bacterium]